MVKLLGQFPGSPEEIIHFLDYMNRQSDRTGLVHNGSLYGLADPPGSISRETETTLGIEFFNCMDEPQVTLFDQIEQR